MPRLANLTIRGSGTYYVRIFPPVDLSDRILKREFLRSLRTKDQAEAAYRLGIYRAGISRLFDMAHAQPTLGPELIDLMEQRIYAHAVGRYTSVRDYARLSDRQRTLIRNDHADAVQMLTQLLSSGNFARHHNQVRTAYEGQFLSPSPDDPHYDQFAEAGIRSLLEAERHLHDLAAGVASGAESPAIAPSNVVPFPDLPAIDHEKPDNSFRTLADSYLAEHKRAWSGRTYEKYAAHLKFWTTQLGADRDIGSIRKQDIRDIRNALGILPAHWQHRYPDQPLAEACKAAREAATEPMSPGAANAYITSLSSFFGWLVKQDFVSENPTKNLKFRDTVRGADKRSAYSVEQLQAIFNAPLYRGMASAYHWKKPGDLVQKDYRYWVPLIALYTGMRLGEILRLTPDSLRAENGIPYFRIGKAKTSAGIRNMPVHDRLVSLGLLDHVAATPKDERLFGGVSERAFSKFYKRLTGSVGIDDSKLVFHSFRHTFADALRQADIDTGLIKALMGHADQGVTAIYGNGYSLASLHKAVQSIEYELTH